MPGAPSVLDAHHTPLKAVRAYVERHPELHRPMQKLPHHYVSTAANFVAMVAPKIPRRERAAAV